MPRPVAPRRRAGGVVRKRRVTGRDVAAEEPVGDTEGRAPLIVDDMLSTGGTAERAARAAPARVIHS